MKFYHGSTVSIEKPKIIETTRKLDFGNGFYCTTNFEQASRWAVVKQKRSENAIEAIVSVYNFDETIFENKNYKIKIFQNADEEWLDFVVLNRNGSEIHYFDITKGAVADDNLFSTITLFEAGILNKNETISRLKPHRLFDQIAFHNSQILSKLEFVGYEKIEK